MSHRIRQLERLLLVEPDDPFRLHSLALEHLKRGERERALEYFDRTIGADADYCYAYYHKARAQESAGARQDAADTLRLGLARAEGSGDRKAAAEIALYLESLE